MIIDETFYKTRIMLLPNLFYQFEISGTEDIMCVRIIWQFMVQKPKISTAALFLRV